MEQEPKDLPAAEDLDIEARAPVDERGPAATEDEETGAGPEVEASDADAGEGVEDAAPPFLVAGRGGGANSKVKAKRKQARKDRVRNRKR